MLKHKLWQHKVEKTWRFLCAGIIDFCRPGHIYRKSAKFRVKKIQVLNVHVKKYLLDALPVKINHMET